MPRFFIVNIGIFMKSDDLVVLGLFSRCPHTEFEVCATQFNFCRVIQCLGEILSGEIMSEHHLKKQNGMVNKM